MFEGLVVHDKVQLAYEDDKRSIGDRSIHKNTTTKALKQLGATINFIDIWLKLFDKNYDARCVAYITAMKDIFKPIPQTMSKPLTKKKSPETYDRYWWWMLYGKSAKGLLPLNRSKISKKAQEKEDEIKKTIRS